MAVSKESIQEIVGIFYQPNFKIFYINSVDERTFIRPVATFVSLGITTSMKVLSGIRESIEAAGYNATIGEISSRKCQGQFLNTLISTSPDLEQYPYTPKPEDNVLTQEEAKEEPKWKKQSEEFRNIREFDNRIVIFLSDSFCSKNGIAVKLFDVLYPFMDKLKISYLKKELRIELKKNELWLNDLEKISDKIHKLYLEEK